MHVTITGVPRGTDNHASEKVERLVVPFVQALRGAYIAARVSDDHSATIDLLTDILVYAARVEGADLDELAAEAARAARGELFDAERDRP
jgi:hypothetical protein